MWKVICYSTGSLTILRFRVAFRLLSKSNCTKTLTECKPPSSCNHKRRWFATCLATTIKDHVNHATILGLRHIKSRDGHSVWYHFVDIGCLCPCFNVLGAGSKLKFHHTILVFQLSRQYCLPIWNLLVYSYTTNSDGQQYKERMFVP